MHRNPGCRLAALGLINNLGSSAEEIWPRLLAGDQTRFTRHDDWVPGRALLVAEVVETLPEIPEILQRFACRNNALTLAALRQIEPQIEALRRSRGPERIGVVMGSSTSGAQEFERAIQHDLEHGALPTNFHYEQLEFGGTAGFVSTFLGLTGPTYALSTACSSGAHALVSARSLLSMGLCDAVVAGATDSLCGLTTHGFSALQAVSDELSNPCSVNRKGLTLGEGSALFLLTAEEGGIQLRGAGESSEAHHISAPDPSGQGAAEAMERALLDAKVDPAAIAYLNLHGTGTTQNDSMECRAVSRVFPAGVPCSSTKPLVGHTLGAAGAIEAAFCWLALRNRSANDLALMPHCYDGVWDPDLPELPVASKGQHVPVAGECLLMTNSFGFGGNNCCLILGCQ